MRQGLWTGHQLLTCRGHVRVPGQPLTKEEMVEAARVWVRTHLGSSRPHPSPSAGGSPGSTQLAPRVLSLRREGWWPEKCSSWGPPPPAGPLPPPIQAHCPPSGPPLATPTAWLRVHAASPALLASTAVSLHSQGPWGVSGPPKAVLTEGFQPFHPLEAHLGSPLSLGVVSLCLSVSVCVHGILGWLRQLRIRLQCRRPWLDSWVHKIRWRRDRLPTPVFLGFPCGPDG